MSENWFGLITMCITSGFIGIYLIRKYYLQRNQFSLYMASFFIIDSSGWFIWFYTALLNVQEIYGSILNTPVIAAQIILLLFVFSVFKLPVIIRVISVISVVLISVISLIIPEFFYLINATGFIVMIMNIILFLMNWQKNNDIKSLGFASGLIIMSTGELLAYIAFIDSFIEGIFLVMAAAIWLFTFSGLLEKMITEG